MLLRNATGYAKYNIQVRMQHSLAIGPEIVLREQIANVLSRENTKNNLLAAQTASLWVLTIAFFGMTKKHNLNVSTLVTSFCPVKMQHGLETGRTLL
jgi:hypothetical protein